MYTIDLSNFIGSWYYTNDKVGIDKAVDDIMTVFDRPDQFNFSVEDIINKASSITGETTETIKVRVASRRLKRLSEENEMPEV